MLEWANNLVYEAYVVETDAGGFYLLNPDGTPKLKLTGGKPVVNPDVPGGDAALKRYVANIFGRRCVSSCRPSWCLSSPRSRSRREPSTIDRGGGAPGRRPFVTPCSRRGPGSWLGKDKALHFAASGAIAAGGYTAGALLFDARGHALILGASIALGAGIAKEAVDLTGYGDPSWRDLTWDAIGTATGLAAAWAVDLMLRGVSDAHPLFVAPRLDRESAGLFVLGRF